MACRVALPIPHSPLPTPIRLCRAMFLEPGEQRIPSVLRLLFAVAGAIVGVKTVWRVGVEFDLRRFVKLLQRLLHLFDSVVRNALIRASVQAKHRGLQILYDL